MRFLYKVINVNDSCTGCKYNGEDKKCALSDGTLETSEMKVPRLCQLKTRAQMLKILLDDFLYKVLLGK